MDKVDIILEKLEKLEAGQKMLAAEQGKLAAGQEKLAAGQKEIRSSQDKMEADILALRMDNSAIHHKIDVIMAAVAETKEELTVMKAK